MINDCCIECLIAGGDMVNTFYDPEDYQFIFNPIFMASYVEGEIHQLIIFLNSYLLPIIKNWLLFCFYFYYYESPYPL